MKSITVTDSRMHGFIFLYDLHTMLYPKAIVGISDEDARNRLNTKANHVAWLAGSLVHERYEMAKSFGIEKSHAGHDLFKNHQGIIDDATYPSLKQYEEDWNAISAELRSALEKADANQLEVEIPMGNETMKQYDLIGFLQYREANCIGQIALYRRLLGYDAIKYM